MEIGLNLSNYRNFRGDTSGQALECRPYHGRLLCDIDLNHIQIQEEEIHQTWEGEEEQINQQPVSYNLSGKWISICNSNICYLWLPFNMIQTPCNMIQ